MKAFILGCLLFSSLYSQSALLVSGLVWHSEKEDIQGNKYKKLVEGVGYQYRFTNFDTSVLVLSDSTGEVMYSCTVGKQFIDLGFVSLGLEGGVASKKIIYTDTKKREVIPIGFAKVVVPFETLDINVLYSPKISFKGKYSPHIVYVNIAYKFTLFN